MTELFLGYKQIQLSNYHSGEEYGDWSTEYEYNITGVYLSKPEHRDFDELGVTSKVEVGDTIYIVYMIFSSGDTFGTASGMGETIWAFTNLSAAIKCCQEINKNDSEYTIEFLDDEGQTIKFSNPAAGYFENMHSCEIYHGIVEK